MLSCSENYSCLSSGEIPFYLCLWKTVFHRVFPTMLFIALGFLRNIPQKSEVYLSKGLSLSKILDCPTIDMSTSLVLVESD